MIPYEKLNLSPRHAQVENLSLATEKHGDEKVSFVDIKVRTLVELDELEDMIRTNGEHEPCQHIFNAADGNLLRMPDIDITAKLREDIKGDLSIKVGPDVMHFEDAHTVGKANKLGFMNGGKGELLAQFRVDASSKQLENLRHALERGEAVVGFEEGDDSGSNENQSELNV